MHFARKCMPAGAARTVAPCWSRAMRRPPPRPPAARPITRPSSSRTPAPCAWAGPPQTRPRCACWRRPRRRAQTAHERGAGGLLRASGRWQRAGPVGERAARPSGWRPSQLWLAWLCSCWRAGQQRGSLDRRQVHWAGAVAVAAAGLRVAALATATGCWADAAAAAGSSNAPSLRTCSRGSLVLCCSGWGPASPRPQSGRGRACAAVTAPVTQH
jgi:hypothetical protein